MKFNASTRFGKGPVRLLALTLCMVAARDAFAARWYVKHNATPEGNGQSWSTAFNDLNDALENPSLDFGDEIWVAAGAHIGPFELKERVRLYGGFQGNETSLADRDRNGVTFTYETVLSGDDSYQVLLGANIGGGDDDYNGDRTVVNGFTIARGLSGAVFLEDAAPVFILCRFFENDGQAVFATGAFDPTGVNRAPEFFNCTFIDNEAAYGAGVTLIALGDAQTVFSNCLFADNKVTSVHAGGAIRSRDSDGRIVNCTFYGNDAEGQVGGGAVHLEGLNSPGFTWSIANSVFWGNIADEAGGEDAQIYINPEADLVTLDVSYTLIEGLTNISGTGNIDDDPEFDDEVNLDFRLGSGSPAIDAGDEGEATANHYDISDAVTYNPNRAAPDLDLTGRIQGTHPAQIDMGCYEVGSGPPALWDDEEEEQ